MSGVFKLYYKGLFLFFLIVILLVLAIIKLLDDNVPAVLVKGENLLQQESFGDFLGINSVRENRKNWIEDQYQVASFHRVFGMDSYIFTGEEIITEMRGAFFKVDPSIFHDEYPNDRMGFNPSKGAGKFNFDKFLSQMKANGLYTIPVLARNLLYTNIPQDSVINVWQIPYDDKGNPEDPLSYKAYSSFLYQFTARYGKNKLISEGGTINPHLLKLMPDNEVKVGLDLVYAIEPGNEMDREWFSDMEYASPKVLAAFLSAAIDGHMGMMGEGHGILTADTDMKIFLPSPTEVKYNYVNDVLMLLKELRKDAPTRGYDVIPWNNFILTAHTYPFEEYVRNERSSIVENTSIFSKSYNYVKKLKSECRCPVYLTETGYDKVTGDFSPVGVPINEHDFVDSMDVAVKAHAKHILRLLFTTYAAGFDKTFLFTLKDPVPVGGKNYRTKFATTGLMRKNGQRDLVWYEIKYLLGKLNNHRLTFAYINQPVNFLLMESGTESVMIFWLGTNSDIQAQFQVPRAFLTDNIAEFVDLSQLITEQQFESECLDMTDATTLTMSEFPQLLIIPK